MIALPSRAIDLDTLSRTVERRLCELGHLEPDQFPMTQREVIRGGRTCGVYYCLHGPRSVKLTAICDFDKNTLLYYGSDGIRRESVRVAVRSAVSRAA